MLHINFSSIFLKLRRFKEIQLLVGEINNFIGKFENHVYNFSEKTPENGLLVFLHVTDARQRGTDVRYVRSSIGNAVNRPVNCIYP